MTETTITPEAKQELQSALKNKKYQSFHKRIQCVLWRMDGLSYRQIAEKSGLSRQTALNCIKRYQEGGLASLLSDKRGGRFRAYMTHDEEKAFLATQFKQASEGKLLTVTSLHQAYQEAVGTKTTRAGFYALLKRQGWRKIQPRPKHPKKADAQAIETSKNKILVPEHMQTIA